MLPHDKSELDEAKDFLKEELSDGPMWAKQVFKDAGVAEKTLRRAKAVLRVHSEKIGTEGWQWSLSSEGGQSDTRDHVGHVDPLHNSYKENSPYLSEDGQGGHEHLDEHVHDHLPRKAKPRRLTEEEAGKR